MITAAQIKRARKRLGESQGAFAKHFDVSRPTIFNWERGDLPTYGPTIAHVEKVLRDLAFFHVKRSAAE